MLGTTSSLALEPAGQATTRGEPVDDRRGDLDAGQGILLAMVLGLMAWAGLTLLIIF